MLKLTLETDIPVGKPISVPKTEDPPNEMVDRCHEIFVQEMIELFEKYKVKYDP